jgi:hypothetical protein
VLTPDLSGNRKLEIHMEVYGVYEELPKCIRAVPVCCYSLFMNRKRIKNVAMKILIAIVLAGDSDEIDHCFRGHLDHSFRGHADQDRSEATLAFVILEK